MRQCSQSLLGAAGGTPRRRAAPASAPGRCRVLPLVASTIGTHPDRRLGPRRAGAGVRPGSAAVPRALPRAERPLPGGPRSPNPGSSSPPHAPTPRAEGTARGVPAAGAARSVRIAPAARGDQGVDEVRRRPPPAPRCGAGGPKPTASDLLQARPWPTTDPPGAPAGCPVSYDPTHRRGQHPVAPRRPRNVRAVASSGPVLPLCEPASHRSAPWFRWRAAGLPSSATANLRYARAPPPTAERLPNVASRPKRDVEPPDRACEPPPERVRPPAPPGDGRRAPPDDRPDEEVGRAGRARRSGRGDCGGIG